MAVTVGIFVDGNNAFYMQKELGWWVDWRALRSYFGEGQGKEVCECHYFTGMPHFADTTRVERQRRFNDALTRMGYTVVTKELKIVGTAPDGSEIRKANLDIELTLGVMQSLVHCTEIVLVEGDGDFAPLVTYARANQRRVICVSSRKRLAQELANAATTVIDLGSIRQHVEDRRKSP